MESENTWRNDFGDYIYIWGEQETQNRSTKCPHGEELGYMEGETRFLKHLLKIIDFLMERIATA